MKIMQTLREEIVPLSSKQNLVLLTIIACIFQFVLFYAPALAADAVNTAKAQAAGLQAPVTQAQDDLIANDSMSKSATMDQQVAELAKPVETNLATSTDTIVVNHLPTATTTIKVISTSTHVITAYNSEAAQTDASPCITANGFNVCEHGEEDTIAANFLKFGTKVQIPELFGDRVFTVRDRMNKKHPNRVDVWMVDRHDAVHFGVKTAKIQVIEITN
jgi:3D (Asp-Asp-Asp) domain-containing protein